ncbi:MAG TPA: chromosome segregation protein SMC [Ktedonobacterales bacterium]|nr:chromosome segregation protein SMC [Ktedonobacterales bacterium]
MFLKRLELHGFKSFAPRTVLEFSPGITAIVGPNGSGKSNVADGIRWVLGEQSMRQLRGKKSDDVIFAGGLGRGTAQMAEVGLVLDNSSGWLPSEFTEVTIARRSFRNGDSEYLANAQRVRLKDVLLLLAQARIGHDSYTVIGQGLVDQALSLRAEERRGLFEDAAGIRQFQAQRTDAEQKLALTQNNLSRLHDIVGEIEPRLGPLAEQARRAHEYTGTHEELLRLLQVWYRSQWRELHIALGRAELAEHTHAANIEQLREALAEQDGEIQTLRQEREAVLAAIAQLRRERGEAANTLQTTERECAVARERLASLDRQQSDIEGEQEQQAEAIEVAHAHIAALEKQMADAEEHAHALEQEMETLARGQHAARQEQEREEARLRAAQREVIQVQARLGATQTELGRLQRQLGDRNRALAGRRDQVAQAQRKLEVADQHLAAKRQTFEAARGEVEEIVAQREQLARDMAEGQTEIERLRAEVGDGERERRSLADRLALLEEWRRNLEGYGDGVRTIVQTPAESRPHILGLVAQLVSAPAGLETAIEAALGVFLQAVVVASQADARQAARWLRESGGGRAIFLWPDAANSTDAPDFPVADGENYLGFAAVLVQCAEDLRPLFAHVLRNAYVVRDLAVAEKLCAGKAPQVPLVTIEGEILHPRGWLRGGGQVAASNSARENTVLGRERELRQLPAEIERLAAESDELKQRYDRAVAQQQQRKVQDEGMRKTLQKAEAEAQDHARSVTALQRDQERAHSELQLSQTVAEQLTAEVEGIEQEVTATAERVAEQERAQQEATERVEDIQGELDDLLSRNRAQQEELTQARTALAVQMQEAKALAQRAEQMRAQTREVEAQLARRGERLTFIASQRDELVESTATQEEQIEELRARTRMQSEQLREHDTHQAELERQSLELERGQGAERQELARLEVEYQRCMMDTQRARDAILALTQQVSEELSEEPEGEEGEGASEGEGESASVDPLRLLGVSADGVLEADAPILPTEEMPKMRRQIDQLRSRLKHLGGYDPEAPQAYEELKTRYEFLTGQIRDMEQASTNLRTIIAELDQTMRRQFEETFRVVNERFQRHFTTLFNGGAARLELTAPRRDLDEDDEEMPEAPVPRKPGFGGVEVYVQIPGKKVQDLSLLSGGERAMVSVALLFALLETNPPPFCLLDEVDAALDEANVVRFCEILKQLAESTQFIVITHNRVTMTNANAIYGISMGGDSVSRVLSMQLEEATAGVNAAAQIQGRRAAASRVAMQEGD